MPLSRAFPPALQPAKYKITLKKISGILRAAGAILRKPHSHTIRLLFLSLLFAGSLAIFVLLIQKQSDYGDVNRKRDELVETGKSLELSDWLITFQNCEAGSCTVLNATPIEIQLPNPSRIQSMLQESYHDATLAYLKHKFSIRELEWLAAYGETYVTFVVATNAQSQTLLKAGDTRTRSANSGIHLVSTVRASELYRAGEVELIYAVDGIDWFGPADLPPAILADGTSSDYLALRERQIASANLYRQLYIGFPFLIAAIALVLDHSVAFTLLALYGLSQALKAFLYYGLDNGLFNFEQISAPIYASTGLGFALVILLALELARINVLSAASKIGFAVSSSLLVILTKTYGPSFIVSSDALIDALASAGGFIVCLVGLGLIVKNSTQETDGHRIGVGTHVDPPSRLVTIRLMIAGFGFAVHGWANLRDLALLEGAAFKDFLDWRHNILFAALMSAALLEVGSTSRKMLRYAQSMVQKALLERDLAIGREVQKRMLPPSKGTDGRWSWRSFYVPATALAGDWYDVRKIEFRDGRSAMLCCLADVTGHGVGAALATSVISSHWTLWSEQIAKSPFPDSPDDFGKILAEAPEHINRGLLALRNNENCTAIFAALVEGIPEIFVVCAGHPGAILTDGRDLRYLMARGPRLGVETEEFEWSCERAAFDSKDTAIIFSDGLVAPGKTVSSWIAGLSRALRRDKEASLHLLMAGQIRSNRTSFRINRDIEDDITIVGFGIADGHIQQLEPNASKAS